MRRQMSNRENRPQDTLPQAEHRAVTQRSIEPLPAAARKARAPPGTTGRSPPACQLQVLPHQWPPASRAAPRTRRTRPPASGLNAQLAGPGKQVQNRLPSMSNWMMLKSSFTRAGGGAGVSVPSSSSSLRPRAVPFITALPIPFNSFISAARRPQAGAAKAMFSLIICSNRRFFSSPVHQSFRNFALFAFSTCYPGKNSIYYLPA